jgi:hypothetical protein
VLLLLLLWPVFVQIFMQKQYICYPNKKTMFSALNKQKKWHSTYLFSTFRNICVLSIKICKLPTDTIYISEFVSYFLRSIQLFTHLHFGAELPGTPIQKKWRISLQLFEFMQTMTRYIWYCNVSMNFYHTTSKNIIIQSVLY